MYRLLAIARRAMTNPILRHNSVFFLSAGAMGLTNYLLSTTLARRLPPGDYSQVGVTLNVLAPIQPLAAAMAIAILRSATENRARATPEVTDSVQRTVLRGIVAIHALLFVAMIVAHDTVSGFFHLTHPALVYLAVMISAVSFCFGLFQATLQEQGRYGRISIAYFGESVFRLVGGVCVIMLGYGVTAVVGVYLLSAILVLVPLPRPSRLWRGAQANWHCIQPILRDAGAVVFANVGLALLTALDVALSRTFLDPVMADRYVALVAVAKFFLSVTGWAGTIAFRHLVEAQQRGDRGVQAFISSFGLIAGLGVMFVGGCALLGELAIGFAFGASFRESGAVLWITAVSAVAVSLLQLETAYFNAIQWPWYLVVFVAGSIGTVLALPLAHGTLRGYATVYAVGTTTLVLMLLVLMIARFRSNRQRERVLESASASLSMPPPG